MVCVKLDENPEVDLLNFYILYIYAQSGVSLKRRRGWP
jgi:hypothetical protein